MASKPLLQDMNDLVQKLRQAPTSDRPDLILRLKQWQRSVLQGTQPPKKRSRSLEALQYERRQLEERIESAQHVDTTTHLWKLVKSAKQASNQPNDEKADGDSKKLSTTDDSPTDELLSDFLGADITDPSQKTKILARLHTEINERGGLERQVAQKRLALKDLESQLAEEEKVLTALPGHLASIERASKGLQRVVQSQTTAHPQQALSARLARIQQAQSLPPVLYTLYQQLQQFQDDGDDLAVIVHNSDTIQWQVPITQKKKKVTIQFQLNTENQVVATATGCAATLYQDHVLDNLFPADSSSSQAYHWCNALAGIALVPSPLSSNVPSTRLVARQLRRRVQANAALKHAITTLQRKTLPTFKGQTSKNCKVVSFQEVSSEGSTRCFELQVELNNKALSARVQVALDEYPARAPFWDLQQPDLYNDDMAALERQINNPEGLVEDDEDADWLFTLQLQHLVSA